MKQMLENVRLDAISKMKSARDESCQLADVVSSIMELSYIAQMRGLLALEGEMEKVSSVLLKLLITLVVDGTDPAIIVEITTNEYWVTAPEGVQAMIDYIYIRGMIAIQSGESRRTLEQLLLSLLPSEQRKKYYEMGSNLR